MIDKLELNTKAQELREYLGEDANSPIDIFSFVPRIEGMTLVFHPLCNQISGICVKNVKLIVINSKTSYGRQRYTLAHELYHLFYDNAGITNICSMNIDSKNETENNADLFASYFLAPYKSLRAEANKFNNSLKLENVIYLEQYYGMSHLAMLWRLINEGYVSKDDFTEFSYKVKSKAKALGYDDRLYNALPDDKQRRTYGHYIALAEKIKERELVSQGKIEELLLDAYRDDLVYGPDIENSGEIID